MKQLQVPAWAIHFPQTPLSVRLEGKQYEHSPVCSGDRRKPKGSSGCCCLNAMKQEFDRRLDAMSDEDIIDAFAKLDCDVIIEKV